jgi:hypothetical protein
MSASDSWGLSRMEQGMVIWFQEEFAFPIDPQVLLTMQAIDWEVLAFDEEY